ncbi:radical SAM protein [Desulfococcaceae bacterium HSG9]|nr:radical SAM protein [Desulfococcaceae bacterium HSG9]
MIGEHFSLILLPTLRCDAACDYCFEKKAGADMSIDQLKSLISKVLDYMEQNEAKALSIHWQGGEVMMMSPQWFARAGDVIDRAADSRNVNVRNYIQSNMIGYSKEWNPIIAEMFDNSVGSSMDYPNRHRKLPGGSAADFNAVWIRNVRQAQDAGIHIGVIALPDAETLQRGAENLYSYFTEELNITDFQINTPFAGGPADASKTGYPLDTERLTQFLTELADIWAERGYHQGVRVGPFDELIEYFRGEDAVLPCIWKANCADEFVCIDPQGNIAQCDCWVASYPQFHFGNIFKNDSLAELLRDNPVRHKFLGRPGVLIQKEECPECDYLAICHGGCPVRAYTTYGDLHTKDPYCETYKTVFNQAELISACLARENCS